MDVSIIDLPYLTLSQQVLDCSKLKESADDNFKFDESGRMFFKRVENTMGKREITRYEQFLLFFPQCFQKTYNVFEILKYVKILSAK